MELLNYIKTLSDINGKHFAEDFGINMNQEGDFFQFKYMMLTAKWTVPMVHESRGVILAREGKDWRIASRPFDKFFNQHEGYCPVFDAEEFARRTSRMEFHEKADGTCIQAWHDGTRWRASTLGTITPSSVGDEPFTFEELFWKVACLDPVLDSLDKEATYVFELCADANRIVTRYENDHCVLIGIRHKVSGEYASLDSGMALTVCEGTNVRLPHRIPFRDIAVKNLDHARQFVEEAKDDPRYGEWPEGFVVYQEGAPVAKMKNTRYVELHAVGGGDIKQSKNKIIEAVFNGNLDDFYVMLSERLKAFADGVQEKVATMISSDMKNIAKVQEGYYPDQKAYALAVKEYTNGPLQSFMFQNKSAVLSKDPLLQVHLEKWLSQNYAKFNWKD